MGSEKDPESLKSKICNDVVARIFYQVSLTIVIVGGILLIILCFQVLIPYLRVVNYEETTCTVVNSTMANDPLCEAEGKKNCPEVDSTSQPCLRINVSYKDEYGDTHHALLHNNEYNVMADKMCSYHAINEFEWKNTQEAKSFEHTYGRHPGWTFKCLWDPKDDSHVIVERYHSRTQVMHTILWPSIGIFLSIIFICGFYCSVGCGVWGDRITTVMWETNLKDLEYDAQMRRIQVIRQKEARYSNKAYEPPGR